jgi:hypothetical protein
MSGDFWKAGGGVFGEKENEIQLFRLTCSALNGTASAQNEPNVFETFTVDQHPSVLIFQQLRQRWLRSDRSDHFPERPPIVQIAHPPSCRIPACADTKLCRQAPVSRDRAARDHARQT